MLLRLLQRNLVEAKAVKFKTCKTHKLLAIAAAVASANIFLLSVSAQNQIADAVKAKQSPGNLKAAVASGKDDVDIYYQDWTDSTRKRTIPVKIYQPKKPGPYPVVIFSHGLGGSRDAATYYGTDVAAHGYLCIALQHPGSDSAVWMDSLKNSGGGQKLGLKQKVMGDLQQAANPENLRLRVGDVKFALDYLEKINAKDGDWHNKIDMTKVACSGHSFGAGTTMAIAGQSYGMGGQEMTVTDPRVKAAIYMSPPVNLHGRDPKKVYGEIKIPGLLMTGTEDNSPINNNTAADRLIPFKAMSATDQYLVNFNGGDHMIFSGRESHGKSKRDEAQDERFHVLINKLSVAFLDAYLKGDLSQKEWLKKSAAAYLGKNAEFESK